MSQILFSTALIPQAQENFKPVDHLRFEHFSDLIEIPRAHLFPWQGREIANLPDVRSYRTLNRTGLILMRALQEREFELNEALNSSVHRVGIYCAFDSGPLHYQTVYNASQLPNAEALLLLLGRTPPKQSFQIAQSFIGAHLSVRFNLRGPLNTYSNSSHSCLHALTQAEFDLAEGHIDRALVCSAFSLEDPLQSAKALTLAKPGAAISEAAVSVVLTKSSTECSWLEKVEFVRSSDSTIFYGISDPLVRLCQNESPSMCNSRKPPGTRGS